MGEVRHGFACIAFCGLMVLLGGCQSSARSPGPPAMVPGARVFVGTPISGPVEGMPDLSPSLVSHVHVRWIALQRMPAEVLAPIDTQSRLIIAPGSVTALPASGRLTRAVRFGSGDTATTFADDLLAGRLGPSWELSADSRLIIPGATLQFTVRPAGAPAETEARISLLVSPSAGGAASTRPAQAVVGVRIAGHAPSGEPDAAARLVRETALIDVVGFADGFQFVVAAPYDNPGTPWTVIAAVTTVNTESIDPVAVEKLRADLKQASEDAKAGLTRSPLSEAPTLHSALAALRTPDSVRPAMLLLTSLSNARIAGDMALVADDGQMAKLADETLRFAKASAVLPIADLRWFLDRYAVQSMCEAAEKNASSPELQSVLALYAGDVARRPDAIVELLKQVGNSDALAERLVAENLIALEDNSPAARARAYDWLVARNKAPANFDPFADAKLRRAAIDKAINAHGGQP